MREKFTPFAALPDTHTPNLHINLDLPPYVDRQALGIAIKRIQRLMRLSGIGSASIFAYDGPQSTFIPDIGPVQSDGSALARATGSKVVAPLADTRLFGGDDEVPKSMRWVDAQLGINMAELHARVLRDRRGGGDIRNVRAWSHQLDAALRAGLQEAGSKQLLAFSEFDKKVVCIAFGLPVYMQAIPMVFGGDVASIPQFLTGIGLSNIVVSKAINAMRREKESIHGTRFNIFYSPEFERAAALHLLLRVQTLVKASGIA